MSVLLQYRVTAAANGYAAGRRVKTDDLLNLTAEAAEYEASLGYLLLVGEAPAQPSIPAILLTDKITLLRDGVPHVLTMTDLVALLAPLLGGGAPPDPVDPEAGFLDLSQPLTTNSLGAI